MADFPSDSTCWMTQKWITYSENKKNKSVAFFFLKGWKLILISEVLIDIASKSMKLSTKLQ